jgi:hypothetical protein
MYVISWHTNSIFDELGLVLKITRSYSSSCKETPIKQKEDETKQI